MKVSFAAENWWWFACLWKEVELPRARSRNGGVIASRHLRSFEDDGDLLKLDGVGGYTTVGICLKSLNFALKMRVSKKKWEFHGIQTISQQRAGFFVFLFFFFLLYFTCWNVTSSVFHWLDEFQFSRIIFLCTYANPYTEAPILTDFLLMSML